MYKVNQVNRQFVIGLGTANESSIDDIQSMILDVQMKKVSNDKKADKYLSLPTLSMSVNLYSSVVTTKDGRVECLEKIATNKREYRKRPKTSQKPFDMNLYVNPKDKTDTMNYVVEPYALGKEWANVHKNDPQANPSFDEIMEGLFKW